MVKPLKEHGENHWHQVPLRLSDLTNPHRLPSERWSQRAAGLRAMFRVCEAGFSKTGRVPRIMQSLYVGKGAPCRKACMFLHAQSLFTSKIV